MDRCARRDSKTQLSGGELRDLAYRRRVRLQADVLGREPQQQVSHHRVPRDRGGVDLGRVDAAAERQFVAIFTRGVYPMNSPPGLELDARRGYLVRGLGRGRAERGAQGKGERHGDDAGSIPADDLGAAPGDARRARARS
jgi:hypothetical protein